MTKSVWRGFGRVSRVVLAVAMVAPVVGFGGCTAGDPLAVGEVSQRATLCGCVLAAACDPSVNPCVQVVTRCSDGTTGFCLHGQVLCEARLWAPGEKTPPACEVSHQEGVCAAGTVTAVCCTGCVYDPRLGGDYYECQAGDTVSRCGTGGEICDSCNDGNTCTTDTCSGGNCVNTPLDGTSCANGTCVDGQCCTGCVDASGNCIPAGEQSAAACGAGGDACVVCDDDKACTGDYCSQGECLVDVLDGQPCDDGQFCNGVRICAGDACQSASPPCTAEEQCRRQVCNEDSDSCEWEPFNIGGECNDGNPCTVADTCLENGTCAGEPRVCPNADGNPCTEEYCDVTAGGCAKENITDPSGSCSFGCITDGTCDNGQCVGDGVVCEARECFTVGCDSSLDDPCVYTPVPEQDVECTPRSRCVTRGTCGPDGNGGFACLDSSEPSDVVQCSDQNDCTEDSCDPDVGCVFDPSVGRECADGELCTTGDQCQGDGSCSGQPVECDPTNDCRELAACNPLNGACSDVPKEDDSPCVDASGVDGTCQGGFCIPTPPPVGGGGAGGEGGAGTLPTGGAAGREAGGAPSSAGSPAAPAAGSPGSAGTPSSGGTQGSSGTTGSAGSEPGASGGRGGGLSDAGSGPEIDPDLRYQRDPAGCSCRTTGEAAGGAPFGVAFLLGSVLLAAVRRRRR